MSLTAGTTAGHGEDVIDFDVHPAVVHMATGICNLLQDLTRVFPLGAFGAALHPQTSDVRLYNSIASFKMYTCATVLQAFRDRVMLDVHLYNSATCCQRPSHALDAHLHNKVFEIGSC